MFVFFTVVLLSATTLASNGSNIQVLHHANRGVTITPEYFWKQKRCGGLSFIDLYERQQFFTNNVVDCNISDGMFLGAEVSANNAGETLKLGIGRRFDIPGLKVFRVTAYPGVWSGFGDKPQLKLVWLTRDWELGRGISLYSTGFYRFRQGIPDAYQPQVWLKKGSSDVHFGIEVFGIGDRRDIQLAVKFVF